MAPREIQLELLIGSRVVDVAGKPVGRIEELRAEQQGDSWVVREFLVGTMGLLRRFSALGMGPLLMRLGVGRALGRSYAIPWQHLDLEDPQHPRLLCKREELGS